MPVSIYVCSALLIALASAWLQLVNSTLHLPYLDEFFHVPQAQQYCLGNYHVWDPKITTPPGLYLIAAALRPLLGCELSSLRFENVACTLALFICLAALRGPARGAHVALNIVLFPPLFFISALYYTDIPSTLSVVIFHVCWSKKIFRPFSTAVQPICLYFLGLVTLFFRQTNIFWVAIYPAAFTLYEHCDKGHDLVKQSMRGGKSGFGDSWTSIVRTSWKMRVTYDRDVREASFEDYIKSALTIIVGLVRTLTEPRDLQALLYNLSPFIALLTFFTSFVYLNGSVVLGDKGNHVATLHLPQMLYIWPYITFFSWPVLLPTILHSVMEVFRLLTSISHTTMKSRRKQRRALPRLRYLLLFGAVAGIFVHFNTIVHPFTLADNRHYTFYVFRMLLRAQWLRYAAIPVYAACAWLCIQSLGSGPNSTTTNTPARQRLESTSTGPKTSTVMIWLATSALQLVTAPLVEPRYFILPWLFWRLDVQPSTPVVKPLSIWHILSLETAWSITVQVVTGYLFLYRPFLWPSEPGSLQRFMW